MYSLYLIGRMKIFCLFLLLICSRFRKLKRGNLLIFCLFEIRFGWTAKDLFCFFLYFVYYIFLLLYISCLNFCLFLKAFHLRFMTCLVKGVIHILSLRENFTEIFGMTFIQFVNSLLKYSIFSFVLFRRDNWFQFILSIFSLKLLRWDDL